MSDKKQSGIASTLIILVIVLLAAVGVAGYVVYQNNNSYTNTADSTYQPPAGNKKSTQNTNTTKTQTAATVPSATTKSNIMAAITSGNTAALQGYMANSVNVILAASEAYGPQTPAKAVQDLSYISTGKNWNFNPPAATITTYQNGDYSQYFPANALVGVSSNKYLVSFQFDSSGKIDGIFMTSNAP